MLAIDAGEARAQHQLSGEPTVDPSFGCPALWIDPAARTGVAFFVTRVRDGEVGDRSSYSRAEERMVDAIGAAPVNGVCGCWPAR